LFEGLPKQTGGDAFAFSLRGEKLEMNTEKARKYENFVEAKFRKQRLIGR
jgi:hypothetical protein